MNPFAAFLLLFAAAVPPAPKGTLCLGRDCRDVEGTTIAISPAGAARQYIWTSSDAKTLVFGTAPAKAETIDLEAKELRTVKLSIRGAASRGWPAETTVTIKEWTTKIAAKSIGKLGVIRLPRGQYPLTVAAPHHVTETRRLSADEKSSTPLDIALKPAPIVTGRVVAKDAKGNEVPVPGVQFLRADGKPAGTNDEQGAFRLELADPLPDQLILMHSGFASKIVAMPKQFAADNDLGSIQLAAGHKLTLHVTLPNDLDPKKVSLTLFEDTKGRYETTRIASRTLTETREDVVFADLAPAVYFLIVNGSHPLEHLNVPITLEESDAEQAISLSPFRVQGTAKLGNKPITEGKLGMRDRNGWDAEMPIEAGQFGGVMWQSGSVNAWVQIAGGVLPVKSPDLGADPTVWDISLRDRRINGRVFDEETKQPVEGAAFGYQRQTGSKRFYIRGWLQPDGTFSILAMEDGTYHLQVEAPGYLNAEATIELTEQDDASRTSDFPMSRGLKGTIELITPSGVPIPNAEVMEGALTDGVNPAWQSTTDAAGRVTLQFRPNETRTLYFRPREGSFAIARVPPPRSEQPVQVVVPAAAGSLKVTTKKPEGTFSIVVMRYNGELLPSPLLRRIPSDIVVEGGVRYHLLPAGTYELWAVTPPRPGDAAAVAAWAPSTAGVRVGLSAGEAAAEVVAQPLR